MKLLTPLILLTLLTLAPTAYAVAPDIPNYITGGRIWCKVMSYAWAKGRSMPQDAGLDFAEMEEMDKHVVATRWEFLKGFYDIANKDSARGVALGTLANTMPATKADIKYLANILRLECIKGDKYFMGK